MSSPKFQTSCCLLWRAEGSNHDHPCPPLLCRRCTGTSDPRWILCLFTLSLSCSLALSLSLAFLNKSSLSSLTVICHFKRKQNDRPIACSSLVTGEVKQTQIIPPAGAPLWLTCSCCNSSFPHALIAFFGDWTNGWWGWPVTPPCELFQHVKLTFFFFISANSPSTGFSQMCFKTKGLFNYPQLVLTWSQFVYLQTWINMLVPVQFIKTMLHIQWHMKRLVVCIICKILVWNRVNKTLWKAELS